jgi:hypothetical protein
MAFNINQFKQSAAGKNIFSRSAHYQMEVTLPPALRNKYKSENLTFSIATTNIPGYMIETTAIRRSGTSQSEYFPIGVSFGDLTMTVLSDGKAEMLNLFRDWQSLIFEVGGLNGTASAENAFRGNSYRVAYRPDYQSFITLRHYDQEGTEIIHYNFFEAFPYAVSDMSLSWGAFNEVLTIPVVFKYRYYTTGSPSLTPAGVGSSQPSKVSNKSILPKV